MHIGNKKVTGFGFLLPIVLLLMPIVVALLLPVIQQARETGGDGPKCKNNLKHLGLAIHNYHDIHNQLPLPQGRFTEEQPPFSWRVGLLPFVEQTPIFQQYDFSTTWDAAENQLLHDVWIQTYQCPQAIPEKKSFRGNTDFVTITGERTIFNPGQPIRFADIPDGTSRTLLFGEIAASTIHWLEPRDLPYDEMSFEINTPNSLGSEHADGPHVAYVDGSVRHLNPEIDPAILKALIIRDDDAPGEEF